VLRVVADTNTLHLRAQFRWSVPDQVLALARSGLNAMFVPKPILDEIVCTFFATPPKGPDHERFPFQTSDNRNGVARRFFPLNRSRVELHYKTVVVVRETRNKVLGDLLESE
jgi:hypothetical protein